MRLLRRRATTGSSLRCTPPPAPPAGAVRTARRSACRLEELDRVAGGILGQNLLAAGSADDLVPEADAVGAQQVDFVGDVVDDEVDAVPAAWLGLSSVGHRPAGGAGWAGEQQPKVAAQDPGERRAGIVAECEAEVAGVELDCLVDVVDHVADADSVVTHMRTPFSLLI